MHYLDQSIQAEEQKRGTEEEHATSKILQEHQTALTLKILTADIFHSFYFLTKNLTFHNSLTSSVKNSCIWFAVVRQ